MAVYHLQVSLPHVSGIPKDNALNTWTFTDGDDADPVNALGYAGLLETEFYNRTVATGFKPASFISSQIERSDLGVTIKCYDITDHLDGSAAGSPIAVGGFTLSAEASELSMPEEVSCALTLRGEGWRGQPVNTPAGPPGPVGDIHDRARRTGSIRFGPLIDTACHGLAVGGGRTTVSNDLRDTLLQATQALYDSMGDTVFTESMWVVWSRRNAAVYQVTDSQVDDALDTQRSRGPKASARTSRDLTA